MQRIAVTQPFELAHEDPLCFDPIVEQRPPLSLQQLQFF